MSTSISGINGYAKSGSTNMDVMGWTGDIEVNTYDSTTTADAGWDDTSASTKKVSGSFDFLYNVAKKPTGATAGLTPGSTPTLSLYIDEVNQPSELYTGVGLITKLSLKGKVKDGWIVTASFVGKGEWTFPS